MSTPVELLHTFSILACYAGGVHVLVIEDDPATAAGIVRGLKTARFEVALSVTGNDGARRILEDRPDAVVLDLMLPERNGFEVLERVHHRTSAPIIVLTARTDLSDRLRVFELGAADFVAKPFFTEELIARIRSRLHVSDTAPKRVVRWANVAVDLDARSAAVGGQPIALTPTELSVLAFLVERRGRAVSRCTLAEQALASLGELDARTVDSHVARLRKKLGTEAAAAIVTVWGIGYRFEPGA
jgi:DNA-binding response OmpR family regulator